MRNMHEKIGANNEAMGLSVLKSVWRFGML